MSAAEYLLEYWKDRPDPRPSKYGRWSGKAMVQFAEAYHKKQMEEDAAKNSKEIDE